VTVEATARGEERAGQPALVPSGPKKGQPKRGPAISGPKVERYEPSYSLPRDFPGGAPDRHAVKGMAPHLSMEEVNTMLNMKHAPTFFSEAMNRAALHKGLGGPEGQTVAWHEKKYYENVPVEHGHGLHNPDQFEAVPATRTERLPSGGQRITGRERERERAVKRVRPQKGLF
jgi:hypothetical protein